MKNKLSVKVLAEIGICAALGYVLDLVAGAYSSFLPFINGGSIGIAMICVFVMSYRRGPLAGFFTGLIMGLLDLLDGFYAITDQAWKVFVQLSCDYVFAYAACSVAGFFKPLVNKASNKPLKNVFLGIGIALGGLLKFVLHFISGVLFWPQFAEQTTAARCAYSLTYNGGYMFPCIILSLMTALVIYNIKSDLFILDTIYVEENKEEDHE